MVSELKTKAMKNLNIITRLLSESHLLLLQGFILVICLFSQSCNYSTAYKFLEQEKVFKDKKYESDKLFKMRDGNMQAPLMSQKGQYNLNFDFIHGFGATMSSAISDNLYIQAGANFLKSKNSTPETSTVIIAFKASTLFFISPKRTFFLADRRNLSRSDVNWGASCDPCISPIVINLKFEIAKKIELRVFESN